MAFLSESLRHARSWGATALDLVFPWPESAEAPPVPITPPFCRQCAEPYPALEAYPHDFTCANCSKQTWYFQWARSGYRTEGQVLESVVGFKYRSEYFRLRQLSNWLNETYQKHAAPEEWDAIVPVPLYHRRRRERGFNQSRELAAELARFSKIPVSDCLYRYRETVSQAGLRRSARWDNMKGAFRMKPKFDVRGQRLLIIDDVFTTGATVNACAQSLAEAGAGPLAVLTVARS